MVLRFISISWLLLVMSSNALAFSWPWTPSYYTKASVTEYLAVNAQWKIIVHRFEKVPGKNHYDIRKISCIEIRTTDPKSIVKTFFINFKANTLMLTANNPSTELTSNFKKKELGSIYTNPNLSTEVTFYCQSYKGLQFLEFFKSVLPTNVYDKVCLLLGKAKG